MILNFHSLVRKPLIKNIFQIFPKFSYREHLKHDKNEPKAYRRILPAAKILMKLHKIRDEELPDLRFIKKENIMGIIHAREKAKSNVEKQPEQVIPKKTSSQLQQVNLFDEVSYNKEIDYNSIKNKLPHSYYYLTANVDRLLTHITEINNNHKRNIKLEDFVAKVIAKLIYKNDKLKILFDQPGNKFINYHNVKDVHIYLKNLNKYGIDSNEQHIYINPHGIALADIAKVKKNLKDFKEKYTPVIRY